MDKCIRCSIPIIRGMKYITLVKDDQIAYMCEQCYLETTKEQQKQAQNAKKQ